MTRPTTSIKIGELGQETGIDKVDGSLEFYLMVAANGAIDGLILFDLKGIRLAWYLMSPEISFT